MTDALAETKTCPHCGRPFRPPPSALFKRFCSVVCRQGWHLARRRRASEALKREELASEKQPD